MKTIHEHINESLSLNEGKAIFDAPIIKPGECIYVKKPFRVKDLDWTTVSDSLVGKFNFLNFHKLDDSRYYEDIDLPIYIADLKTKDSSYYSGYFSISNADNLMYTKGEKSPSLYRYKDSGTGIRMGKGLDTEFAKFLYLGIKQGYLGIRKINDDDKRAILNYHLYEEIQKNGCDVDYEDKRYTITKTDNYDFNHKNGSVEFKGYLDADHKLYDIYIKDILDLKPVNFQLNL